MDLHHVAGRDPCAEGRGDSLLHGCVLEIRGLFRYIATAEVLPHRRDRQRLDSPHAVQRRGQDREQARKAPAQTTCYVEEETVLGYALIDFPLEQQTDQETSAPGYDLHLSTAGHHQTGSQPWLTTWAALWAQNCIAAHGVHSQSKWSRNEAKSIAHWEH